MVQPLWKTVSCFIWSAIWHLPKEVKNLCSPKNLCYTRAYIKCIAAVFIITKAWKQPRCPSVDEWMNKLWCIHTMDTVLCFLCLVAQSSPTFCYLMDYSPPGSSIHVDSPSQSTGMGCHDLLQGLISTQGFNPRLLHCRWILLPSEPPGKPKNTRVGSLSLLRVNFLTQDLNQGLLHCRCILYQLSYPGSPQWILFSAKKKWACQAMKRHARTLNAYY